VNELHLHAELWLPRPSAEVFPFFGDAQNLERITPPWLRFEILSPLPMKLGVGALIDYRIRLHGIPILWRTRISAWEPPHRFMDEQVRGPYRQWIHEHTFEDRDGGSLCRDHVRYAVPGGALVDKLFVRREVEKIFAYRQAVLRDRFAR